MIGKAAFLALLAIASAMEPLANRDRAVIEAVGGYLAGHPGLLDPVADPKRTQIVLDAKPPKVTEALLGASGPGDEPLPSWASRAPRERNNPTRIAPLAWKTICTPCAAPLLLVEDVDASLLAASNPDLGELRFMGVGGFDTFERAFPTAYVWIRALLPAYSQDGSEAVVRASLGPSPHGCLVTVLLHLRNGRWEIERFDVLYLV